MSGKGNSRYGVCLSKNTKQKISKALTGRVEPLWKRHKQSDFMKKNNPMNSLEARKKVSLALKGMKRSKEWLKNLSIGHKKGLGIKKYEDYCLLKNILPSIEHYRIWLVNKESHMCKICKKTLGVKGNKGVVIHHKDRNQKNNRKENVIFICTRCHNHIHLGDKFFNHNKWKEDFKDSLQDIPLYGEKNDVSRN
jgi:hypothetical protein